MPTESSTQRYAVDTTPINNLPIEVLEEVFTSYYRSKIFSPLILKLVCQRWRQIVDCMPIMRSDVLLAPNLGCQCSEKICWRSVWIQCKTVSQMNQVLEALGHFKFELTVLGCGTCFRSVNVYDTNPDKRSIDLRCTSLQIFCPVDLATPLIRSINDVSHLQSFKAGVTLQNWSQGDDDRHIAINHILLKKPRLLRKLGVFHVQKFELDDGKREALRFIDSCILRGTSFLSEKKARDLASSFENVTKVQWVFPGATSQPVVFPRLKYLYLESRTMQPMLHEAYGQLTTLKLARLKDYSDLTHPFEMPKLRHLYIIHSNAGVKEITAPKLNYLYVSGPSIVTYEGWPPKRFGSILCSENGSMRPHTIATESHISWATEFGSIWENVEQVEIHVSSNDHKAEDAARVIVGRVQTGEITLRALRYINIVLKGNTSRDVERGTKVLKDLKSIIHTPLMFNGSHLIQVRHRWAYYKYDICAIHDCEMDEGSDWLNWEM